jgi:hypothetical protein
MGQKFKEVAHEYDSTVLKTTRYTFEYLVKGVQSFRTQLLSTLKKTLITIMTDDEKRKNSSIKFHS